MEFHPGGWIGPYQVVRALGEGGVGVVYHVRDSNGRDLAVKLMARQETASPQSVERFKREGSVTAALQHPGIVSVHDAGLIGPHPYLVYELVEGSDFEGALGRLPRDAQLRILQGTAEALGYAHAQGVVHRDVKPANVLLDTELRPKVADFGMALVAGLEKLTRTGALVGTPSFMAPEQVRGQRNEYGPQTDVWALGVMLYQILTQRLPFHGESLVHIAAVIIESQPPPPRSLDSSISPGLEAVCLKALQKSPELRYADGSAFAADLDRAIRGLDVAGGRGKRSRRLLLLALGSIALALALVIGKLLVDRRRASAPTPTPTPTASPSQSELPGPVLEAEQALKRALELAETGGSPKRVKPLARTLAETEPGRVRLQALCVGLLERTLQAARAQPSKALPLLRLLKELGPTSDLGESLPARSLLPVLLDYAYARLGANDQTKARTVLELAADVGLRSEDRGTGRELTSEVARRTLTRELKESDVWEFLLVFARLDLELDGTHFVRMLHLQTPPWTASKGSWERYVELRVDVELREQAKGGEGEVLDGLRDLLRAGKPRLGRLHRAAAVAITFVTHTPEDEKFLQEALAETPENPWVLARLGRMRGAGGASAEAAAFFERAEKALDPDHPEFTHYRKERIYFLADVDREAAKKLFRESRLPQEAVDNLLIKAPWLREKAE